jgi:diphthine synthase
MLYLIGLGIYDEHDIPLRALEILGDVERVYAEFYTSASNVNLKNLEKFIGKRIQILDRPDLEEHPEENVLKDSLEEKTALLVSGDPMVATTHTDLILRARKLGIETKIIHASSIYSAIAETGLQIYKFGKTTSVPFPEKSYSPTSPYDVLRDNIRTGLHTLFLLDVKPAEKRFMSVNDAIKILLVIEGCKRENMFTEETRCVGAARLGNNSIIKFGQVRNLLEYDFGKPPHVLIVPGELHFMEEEMLKTFAHP